MFSSSSSSSSSTLALLFALAAILWNMSPVESSGIIITNSVLQCAQIECSANFPTCHAHSVCSQILQCWQQCESNEADALIAKTCQDACPDQYAGLGVTMWEELLTCANARCVQEFGDRLCAGHLTQSSCEANTGCSFSQNSCIFADITPPDMTCPLDIQRNLPQSDSTRQISWQTVTAVDQDQNVEVIQTQGPVSGSDFGVGSTTISYTSTDEAGNTAECSFTITVSDVTPPSFSRCPNDLIITPLPEDLIYDELGYPLVSASWLQPLATDNVQYNFDEASPISTTASVPIGSSVFNYTAVDPSGNSAVCSFSVQVTPTALSYFRKVNHYWISDGFDAGFFVSNVSPKLCAQRCQQDADCQSFSTDRSGNGECRLSGRRQPDSNYVYNFDYDYYEKQNASLLICPGYPQAQNCLQAANQSIQSDSSSSNCHSAASQGSECLNQAFIGCFNEDIMAHLRAQLQWLNDTCDGQQPEPWSFESVTEFQCSGPFTSLGQCRLCCQDEYTLHLSSCKNPLSPANSEPDQACKINRWEVLQGCTSECVLSRPFEATGSIVNGSRNGVSRPSRPVTDSNVIISLSYSLSQVMNYDAVADAELILSIAAVYGFDPDTIWMSTSWLSDNQTLVVTVEVLVQDSFTPLNPTVSSSQRRRRSTDQAATLALNLQSVTSQANYRSTLQSRLRAESEQSFGIVVVNAYGNGTTVVVAPSVVIPVDSPTTTTITTSFEATTTTTSATTTAGSGSSAGSSDITDDDRGSAGVIAVGVIGGLFILIILVLLLASCKKQKRSSKVDIAASSRDYPLKKQKPDPNRTEPVNFDDDDDNRNEPERPFYHRASASKGVEDDQTSLPGSIHEDEPSYEPPNPLRQVTTPSAARVPRLGPQSTSIRPQLPTLKPSAPGTIPTRPPVAPGLMQPRLGPKPNLPPVRPGFMNTRPGHLPSLRPPGALPGAPISRPLSKDPFELHQDQSQSEA